jgi:hypothetical protein
MLSGFYGAFSPACFALLGLWLVVVQIRLREWQGSAPHRRRSYGVALYFAVIALSGAVLILASGRPARSVPDRAGGLPAAPAADQLGLAAYLAGIALYLLIGALAVVGGLDVLRTEAVLLTLLVFLGFNVAWLLLFDSRQSAPAAAR